MSEREITSSVQVIQELENTKTFIMSPVRNLN